MPRRRRAAPTQPPGHGPGTTTKAACSVCGPGGAEDGSPRRESGEGGCPEPPEPRQGRQNLFRPYRGSGLSRPPRLPRPCGRGYFLAPMVTRVYPPWRAWPCSPAAGRPPAFPAPGDARLRRSQGSCGSPLFSAFSAISALRTEPPSPAVATLHRRFIESSLTPPPRHAIVCGSDGARRGAHCRWPGHRNRFWVSRTAWHAGGVSS